MTPDPIFAAIAEHKALAKSIVAAQPEHEEWLLACAAASKAARRMVKTRPTTPAGAAALINYVRREIKASFVLGLDDWMVPALKTVASALTRGTDLE